MVRFYKDDKFQEYEMKKERNNLILHCVLLGNEIKELLIPLLRFFLNMLLSLFLFDNSRNLQRRVSSSYYYY